jgi:hypothetical protein
MMLGIAEISGLHGIPSSRMGLHKWLRKNEINTIEDHGRFVFELEDLPRNIQDQFISQLSDDAGIDMDVYLDEAHVALLQAPTKVQERGSENMAKLLFVSKHERLGQSFSEIEKAGKKSFCDTQYSEKLEAADKRN